MNDNLKSLSEKLAHRFCRTEKLRLIFILGFQSCAKEMEKESIEAEKRGMLRAAEMCEKEQKKISKKFRPMFQKTMGESWVAKEIRKAAEEIK